MSQSRRHSALETTTDVALGIGGSIVLQLLLFPAMGWHPTLFANFQICAAFTAWSWLRKFAVRRGFNAWHARGATLTAEEREVAIVAIKLAAFPIAFISLFLLALKLGGSP